MVQDPPYQLFADVVLAVHFAVVLFVLGGLLLIILGNLRGWPWVNAPWFRIAHLGTIALVFVDAWLGATCPLTTLEAWLRARAGTATYRVSFIQHWLQRLLFYEAPAWVFMLAYSLFGLLVVATWWAFRPRFRSRDNDKGDRS